MGLWRAARWAAAVAAVIIAAVWGGGIAAAADLPAVYIYTWSDYFDSEVLRDFEKQAQCRIVVDYFDSNEAMHDGVRAGSGNYDIVTPSSYMAAIMRKQGMLLPLDHALLPNLGHIDRDFSRLTGDEAMEYSVPYTRTVTGVGYNARLVDEEDLGSWAIFSRADYAGRMTMLDDMRESIGAALKFLGHSLNTTDDRELARAGEVLAGWKGNLDSFGVDEAKYGLVDDELLVIQAYNGDAALLMDENPDIGFFIPGEGSSLASDDFVVCKDSPNPRLAHAFINYMLDPETAKTNMESIRYFMPNPEALKRLEPELRESPVFNVDEDVLAKCEVIRDLGPDNEKYVTLWNAVTAAE